MERSRLWSRRTILGLGIAGALSRVIPARAAQSTAGCDISFTYGLLTIGGDDCKLLSPPGMDGANISLPIQMIDDRGNGSTSTSSSGSVSSQGTSSTGTSTTSSPSTTSSTTSPQAERQAKLQKRRDKKRTKRGRKTDKSKTQKGRHQTRKQARRDAQEKADRLASLKQCTDFADQKSAFEYMSQYIDNRETLDPDKDGAPCEDLPPITCKQIWDAEGGTREDMDAWFKRHGITNANNPFGFNVSADNVICPKFQDEEPQTTEETPTTTEAQFVNG